MIRLVQQRDAKSAFFRIGNGIKLPGKPVLPQPISECPTRNRRQVPATLHWLMVFAWIPDGKVGARPLATVPVTVAHRLEDWEEPDGHVKWRREGPQRLLRDGPSDSGGGDVPHLSIIPPGLTRRKTGEPLQILELIETVNACLTCLNDYAVARAALIHHSLALHKVPGGPWQGCFVRDHGEGALQFTGVSTAIVGHQVQGVGMVRNDNPHAAFRDFRLIDAAGNPPAKGTPAEVAQTEQGFYLARTRDAVNALQLLLPAIECLHIHGADTQSLTRLRIALPQPPYLPLREKKHTFRAIGDGWTGNVTLNTNEGGVPADRWEEILSEERKLIDGVRFDLNRIVMLAQRSDWKPTETETTGAKPREPIGSSTGSVQAPRPPAVKPDPVAVAVALKKQHPDWSDRKIATQAGCNPSKLSRDAFYQQVKAAFASGAPPRGTKDRESGDVEAVDE